MEDIVIDNKVGLICYLFVPHSQAWMNDGTFLGNDFANAIVIANSGAGGDVDSAIFAKAKELNATSAQLHPLEGVTVIPYRDKKSKVIPKNSMVTPKNWQI